MVEAYLNGIFPRSKALIAATRGLDRRRVSESDVQKAMDKDVQDLVALQLRVGFDYLSDGLLNWQDLFRPFAETWDGLEPGGLTRWFDNNTFYRKPVISGSLRPQPMAEAFLRINDLPGERPWQAVLPGPYTFLALSEDHHHASRQEGLRALSDGLRTVATALGQEGFQLLHFQEPGLAVNPPDGEVLADLKEVYEDLRIPGTKTALHLYFGSAQPLLPDLLDFPVDLLGLDLYQEELDRLKDVDFTKTLVCGCVDSRNSHLETPEEVAEHVMRLRERLDPPEVVLAPNADLEFLPRSVARAKVEVLGAAKTRLEDTS